MMGLWVLTAGAGSITRHVLFDVSIVLGAS